MACTHLLGVNISDGFEGAFTTVEGCSPRNPSVNMMARSMMARSISGYNVVTQPSSTARKGRNNAIEKKFSLACCSKFPCDLKGTGTRHQATPACFAVQQSTLPSGPDFDSRAQSWSPGASVLHRLASPDHVSSNGYLLIFKKLGRFVWCTCLFTTV